MNKYIDAEKLKAEIERMREINRKAFEAEHIESGVFHGRAQAVNHLFEFITSLQQEQPAMIQWTGNNLKEVIDFTGKSPRFEKWFKSWEEFESYVHSHGDILKLFSEDGSHFEVPVGAWIVKTPDGYNVPSVARFIHAKQERPEVDLDAEIDKFLYGTKFKRDYDGVHVPGVCMRDWKGKKYVNRDVTPNDMRNFARHFYEIGKTARKEE